MLRHFMSERFGLKSAPTRFSSQSWARFMIQKRQDIEEMTFAFTLGAFSSMSAAINWDIQIIDFGSFSTRVPPGLNALVPMEAESLK